MKAACLRAPTRFLGTSSVVAVVRPRRPASSSSSVGCCRCFCCCCCLKNSLTLSSSEFSLFSLSPPPYPSLFCTVESFPTPPSKLLGGRGRETAQPVSPLTPYGSGGGDRGSRPV